MSDKKAEALKLVEEALFQLESPKGTVTAGVQKLSRAAKLLDSKSIYAWTSLQLGNDYHVRIAEALFKKVHEEYEKTKTIQQINDTKFENEFKAYKESHLPISDINESFGYKMHAEGGQFNTVEFIEEKFNLLKREKRGNDGINYRNPLQHHLSYIKKRAHKYAANLYEKLKFSGTVASSFDLLKNAVDDKLLDLNPELAEQLMLAFKSISADSKEEWSQALTTCRRLLEGLADQLFPATDAQHNGRPLKQSHYINRLWAFMDQSIKSNSNKDLAKAHIDFLGSWLQKSYALTNKGVHAEVSQLEATRVVFHMYLLLGDLLEYLDPNAITKASKPLITEATLDEIEALLNVNRNVAKDIVRARVENKGLTLEQLGKVKGVGPKSLATAKEVFIFP